MSDGSEVNILHHVRVNRDGTLQHASVQLTGGSTRCAHTPTRSGCINERFYKTAVGEKKNASSLVVLLTSENILVNTDKKLYV